MSDTMREDLLAAMGGTASEATPAPAVDASSEAPADVEAAPVAPPPAAPESPAKAVRDAAGKFAPKAKAPAVEVAPKAEVKPVDAKTAAVVPAAATETPAAPAAPKAPQSWAPAAREHWAKLPPEVQAEAVRREKETMHALQESAQARKFTESFGQMVQPHMRVIQAEGGDPIRALDGILRTVGVLQTGSEEHKAVVAAQLCKAYGVNLSKLDAALAGQTPPEVLSAPREFKDPRVDQLFAGIEAAKARQSQALMAAAAEEIEAFAPQAEFLDDVREEVADLLEVAARRGVALSPKDAYDRIVSIHPKTAPILRQREAAAAAANAPASTQRARAAGSSVKSSPSGGVGGSTAGRSIADELRAAAEALNR